MSQTIPSGVWTVLEGASIYQTPEQDVEVYQNTGQDVEATIVGPYGEPPRDYWRVNASPDVCDFMLRPAGYTGEDANYPNWEGSKLSGVWYPG